jgi:hypothetical protein
VETDPPDPAEGAQQEEVRRIIESSLMDDARQIIESSRQLVDEAKKSHCVHQAALREMRDEIVRVQRALRDAGPAEDPPK